MLRLLIVAVALSATLPAHTQERVPRRPRLPAGADSSDPLANYRYGLSVIDEDPRAADAAFYWALRLSPSWAEALYARRVAVLRSDERRLLRYMRGDKSVVRQLRWADSLMYRSRLLDPFIYQDLDRNFLQHYLRTLIAEDLQRRGYTLAEQNDMRHEIDVFVDKQLSSDANVGLRAWMAFSAREMQTAAQLYGKIVGQKSNPDAREDRATVFYLVQRYDSAAAELEKAIVEFADRDRKEEIPLYRPKALLYYKLALARAKENNLTAAQDAFGKALEEDLSFYPAHITLAQLAITKGDTATALRELDLAVQLGPNEVLPFIRYAEMLVHVGRDNDAVAPLKKVIESEPYYAPPRLRLARVLDKQGDKAGAIEQYNAFLRTTPRNDQFRGEARERIVALGGSASGL
jgi:tetratricopeptide (TPR) repeat protein